LAIAALKWAAQTLSVVTVLLENHVAPGSGGWYDAPALPTADCGLTHEAAQPTLNRTLEASPAEALHALNLVEAAALRAVQQATSQRAPITPCFALTEALVLLLVRRGVLTPCTDADVCGTELVSRALYDPLRWRYLAGWEHTPGFEHELRVRLRELAARKDAAAVKARALATACQCRD
jgi:hypothetical protein